MQTNRDYDLSGLYQAFAESVPLELSSTGNLVEIYVLGSSTKKVVDIVQCIVHADKSLTSIHSRHMNKPFDCVRGLTSEVALTTMFNLEAIDKGSGYRAVCTGSIKGLANHSADAVIVQKGTTVCKKSIVSIPKGSQIQVKMGKTSGRQIANSAYDGMIRVSELPSKIVKTTSVFTAKGITAGTLTSADLTYIAERFCGSKPHSGILRFKTYLGTMKVGTKILRAVFSKVNVAITAVESFTRNGISLYSGEIGLCTFVKEIFLDVSQINTALFAYDLGSSAVSFIKEFITPCNGVAYLTTPRSTLSTLGMLGLESSSHLQQDLSVKLGMVACQDISNTMSKVVQPTALHSETINITTDTMLDLLKQSNDATPKYDNVATQLDQTPDLEPAPLKQSQQNVSSKSKPFGAFGTFASGACSQVFCSAATAACDKLIRGQPITARDVVAAGGQSFLVYGGGAAGAAIAKEMAKGAKTIAVGSGMGVGIVVAGIDLAVHAWNGTLTPKTAGVAVAKGAFAGGAATLADITIKALSTGASFGVGAAIGGVVEFAMSCYRVYETRTLENYDMNKFTWVSVLGSTIKGAIMSSVAIGGAAIVANCWNPVGWVAFGAALVVGIVSLAVYGISTYAERKFSDNFGQRSKHLDHCCEILKCTRTATKEEFAKSVRRTRAQFHPDKTTADDYQKKMLHIQECIDAYYMLRYWEAESTFVDAKKANESTPRKLLKELINATAKIFQANDIAKFAKKIKESKCFIGDINIYEEDFPENVHEIQVLEDCDFTSKVGAIYISEENKDYAITDIKTTLINGRYQISGVRAAGLEPLRSCIILNYEPVNNDIIKKKIGTNAWLIGLTDLSPSVFEKIVENNKVENID
jgi:hypothetical protein